MFWLASLDFTLLTALYSLPKSNPAHPQVFLLAGQVADRFQVAVHEPQHRIGLQRWTMADSSSK
jgi:hypothetical protein